MLRERKNYKIVKEKKEQAGLWLLALGALFLTFNPLSLKEVFSLNPQATTTDLLVTNFIETIQAKMIGEGNITNSIPTGVGGVQTDPSELITTLYVVQPGESLWSIAKKEGLNIDTLLSANELKNGNSIRAGQEIKIPNQEGIFYRIKKGQNLKDVANAYQVKINKLLDVNDLASSRDIKEGKKIFVPGAKLLPAKRRYLLADLSYANRNFIKPLSAAWLSSPYGYRKDPFTGDRAFHTGIDLAACYGSPVRASKAGKVISSGWGGGYGNLIIIRHDNGYKTYYGHLSRRLVEEGEWVEQGQVVGRVGNSGRSLGAHLHFEIRKNGCPINPSSYVKYRG